MSLFDLVVKGAKVVGEKMQNFTEDFQKYKEEYKTCDNEELKKLCSSTSGAKKLAIMSILKDRGLIMYSRNKQYGRNKQHEKRVMHLLQLSPDLSYTWGFLGDGYYNNGQYKAAKECYLKAIEIDPNYDYYSIMIYECNKRL